MQVRLVVADGADLMRLGMQALLATQTHWVVEAVVAAVDDVLRVAQRQPSVIILDERLDPETDVLCLVERVRAVAAHARLIITGQIADGLLVRDLFACGVKGYLYKADALQDCLIPAIETVVRDRPYLSPTANTAYLVAMQSADRDWRLDAEARMVLRLLAQGQHVGQIALALGTAPRRVYWVRQKLRKRFGAVTNEHLISRAAAEGFVFPV